MQSLMVYCDFQYNDAMSVLRRIKAFPDQSSFEVKLNKAHAVLMRELGDVPVIPNPLLEHMESILINQYSKYPQSRGIFFVRGIRHTEYIVKWIESSLELSPVIKASSITGHHRGGMEKGELSIFLHPHLFLKKDLMYQNVIMSYDFRMYPMKLHKCSLREEHEQIIVDFILLCQQIPTRHIGTWFKKKSSVLLMWPLMHCNNDHYVHYRKSFLVDKRYLSRKKIVKQKR